MAPKKVTIIGSGNWGSAIARIVGHNATTYKDIFDPTVNMWVFEEIVDGRKLSEIINTQHENVKYLPGRKLPENVVAVTDVVEASKEADILIFVVPHQHVGKISQSLAGKLKDGAKAISLIKGLSTNNSGGIKLISEEIREILHIEVSVLMGANLAHEVADDHFCEATIGTLNKAEDGEMWTKLFNTDNFRINVVKDANTVELCGALKNIVACAAGFADGLKLGDNTKAALIRIGLIEMMKFVDTYYPGSHLETYFESCGVADLVTTCYGGRNRKVCAAFVTAKKPLAEVEQELLNGQSAQGPLTAEEIYPMLQSSKNLEKFPLFVAVHRICKGEVSPDKLIDCIKGRC